MCVYEQLQKLGIAIPEPPSIGGLYVPIKQVGKLLYTSGQGPVVNGVLIITGKLGTERSIEEGQLAARICIINTLSILQKYLKDLNRVENVVKLLGFVASAAGFNDQPKVINSGSQLLIDIFGERGRHARSAIGVYELPRNMSVEIEAIFEVRD